MLSSIKKSSRTITLALFITTSLFFFFSAGAFAATVTLAWDRPEGDTVAGYNIYYGPSGTNYKSNPRKTINSPDQTQVDIANLEPGETYAFSATSHDGNGYESDFSEEITHEIPGSEDEEQFTITAGAGSGGTIEPAGDTVVSYGGSVSYAISPDNGYSIADVTVNGSSVGPTGEYTFSDVTADNSISAVFEEKTYTITASAGSGGTIEPAGDTVVSHGGSVSYAISPDNGYSIADVTVNGSSVGPTGEYIFSDVTADNSISAVFEEKTYTITASAGNGGTIEPAGDTVVSYGGSVSYAISPDNGYSIADVTVNGSSVGPKDEYTFSDVTANNSISAVFEEKTYTITASAGSGGTIEPAGDTLVSHGGSVSYAISPDTGHEISDVTVNGSSVGSVESYTISNITSDNIINAIFSEMDPAEYFSGAGTIDDPFLIFDSDQLDCVRNWPDSHFKLKHDIDLGDFESFVPIGSYQSPFTGSFDGNSHIIKNLVIDEAYRDYVGVFACLEGAIIKNTGIENADVLGRDYVGILAGHVIDVTISETYVTGFVSGQHFVGGLVGFMEADSIALVSDSYADSNVDGSSDVGGLVGNLGLMATIENTYAVGNVQGSTDIGGLVGWNNKDLHDNVINSFWDAQIGPDESKGGTGKTTDEMMQQSTFTKWDFDTAWTIDEGRTCPKLQWQETDSGSVNDSYTITASAGSGGFISPDGETLVSHGESISYTISPDGGYLIEDVSVNGSSVGPVESYTIENVTSDKTINATFIKNRYTRGRWAR